MVHPNFRLAILRHLFAAITDYSSSGSRWAKPMASRNWLVSIGQYDPRNQAPLPVNSLARIWSFRRGHPDLRFFESKSTAFKIFRQRSSLGHLGFLFCYCFITKQPGFHLEKAHWVNAVRKNPMLKLDMVRFSKSIFQSSRFRKPSS
jgi:hypothetical protein